jgi:O-antigen/teichoic acid export membrane protein
LPNKSSSFLGNILKLAVGSVLAQGLGILASPIVTRLFSPEEFGISALFISITGIVGMVACFQYEQAIMLPKTDEEAANLFGASFIFVLITTIMSVIIIFFAGDFLVKQFNVPDLKKYLWLVPISLFFSGLSLPLINWTTRLKRFSTLSSIRVVSSVLMQSTKISAGFAGFISAGILIITGIIGNMFSCVYLCFQIFIHDRKIFFESINLKSIFSGIRKYKNFPLYSTWSILLNSISRQLPIWFLAYYFTSKNIGYYSLGITVVFLPMTLIGGAVSQVFFQKVSETYSNTGQISSLVEDVFKRLVSFGLLPFLLLTVIGEDIFSLCFGARWAEAGIYIQILSLWVFFVFISSPLSTIFNVLGKQKYLLVFNSLLLLVRCLSLYAGCITGDIVIALLFFSISGIILYLFLCLWILSISGINLNQSIGYLLLYTLFSSPIVCLILWIKQTNFYNLSSMVLIGLATFGFIIYYLIIFTKDVKIRESVQSFYRSKTLIKK